MAARGGPSRGAAMTASRNPPPGSSGGETLYPRILEKLFFLPQLESIFTCLW